MNKLIEASRAGVRITMIVRGICCLVPGVRKKTENIRIQSVVGRYLEHSRLYIFGERDNVKVYISSADWMTRNMSRRVEIACPILDNSLSRQLQEIFEDYCSDTAQSWKLEEDGQYRRIAAVKGHSVFNAQESFYHGNQD